MKIRAETGVNMGIPILISAFRLERVPGLLFERSFRILTDSWGNTGFSYNTFPKLVFS